MHRPAPQLYVVFPKQPFGHPQYSPPRKSKLTAPSLTATAEFDTNWTVPALMPQRLTTVLPGSVERAIWMQVTDVVRAFGWIYGTCHLYPPAAARWLNL